jgi:PAS domain S-box-containing protein
VSNFHSDRYRDRQTFAITIAVLLVLLVLGWLARSLIGWWAGSVLLFLAMGGGLFLYRYIQPFARKLTEALRRNELILQYAGEGIYSLDLRGRMTFINAAAERMLGYTKEDLGRNLIRHIIPHGKCDGCLSHTEDCSILEVCRDGDMLQCNDAVFLRKNGRPLDVRCISAPIGEADLITGAVVVFSDNTARKQNEAALARWQHVFAHARWGVIVCNAELGQIELVNPAFARMHSYTVEELAGFQVVEFFAEECKADLGHHVRLIHEQGHHIWESWHVRKDGSRFPVQLDATAVKDEAGKVLYRIINVQNITARRQAEDVLRESEALLACAQAQGKLGSWQLDISNGTLEWSAECYRIFALPQGTPLNYQRFLDCVHPDDRAFVDRAWRAALTGDHYDIQHRIVADGKIKWVRERVDLEFAPDWTPMRGIGTVQDITELKQHEDELLRSRQSLRELAAHHEKIREAERTRIAREIHDELGQFLTALRIDAAMLKLRFGEVSIELERHADAMKMTIDATIEVVRNLASSLRPGALDMGLISAAEWLLSGFEQRTRIRCRLHAPQEHLALDEERGTATFRILQESLTNIARHAGAAEVNVRIELVNGVLEMDIRDDGVGFDHADVQSRKTFGLMGMRERALQFGGEFYIDTHPGAGAAVQVRIPCLQGGIQ